MNRFTVRLFAVFRELAGRDTLELSSAAGTPAELFAELTTTFPGLKPEPAALVAVNDELCGWDQSLSDGDTVLFFPPVAGG